jgi:uncharacterized RDD family membrane protein YckC
VATVVAQPETRTTTPPNFSRAIQGSLFPSDRSANKVIPIAGPAPRRPAATRPKTATGTARRAPRISENQGQLDFVQAAPARPRTLSTTVEAVIYCEAPVATPLHRAVAAAIDWSIVSIAYGLFLAMFHFCGGTFDWNKGSLLIFGAAFLLLGFTYGGFFALAGTETAGMRWAQLRLITFDGFPPEPRHRIIRFVGACLSRCAVLGLLWSLADEESLTWQDHISRTFPTPYELDSRVFRRR